jgi:DNA-binding Lrp family transcriptional regulator
VIKRRIALLDPLKLGLGLTAFVSVQVGDHSGKAIARFAAEIAAMEEVMECYRMAGDVDYGLRVVVPDAAAFDVLQASDRNNSAQERYIAFRLGKRQIRNCLSNCLPELTARWPEHWFPDPCRAAPPDFHRGRPAPARKFAKSRALPI